MTGRHAVWLAAVGAGLLASSGAAGAAPATESTHRPTQDTAQSTARARGGEPTDSAWYRIRIRYRGEKRFVRHSVDRFGAETREEEVRTGSYRVASIASRLPALVFPRCPGRHLALLPVGLRNSPASCREVRRRGMALLEGKERREFLRRYNRGARETYDFRDRLVGEVSDSRTVTTVAPITVRSPGGRRVPCTPPQLVTTREQTAAQKALVVTLASGSRPGRFRSERGVRVRSRMAPQTSRLDARTNLVTCPGFDGIPPRTLGGSVRSDQPASWDALDHGVALVNSGPIANELAFTRPPGTFGRRFTVERRVVERRREPITPVPFLQTLERHSYTFIFAPCPKRGTVRVGC